MVPLSLIVTAQLQAHLLPNNVVFQADAYPGGNLDGVHVMLLYVVLELKHKLLIVLLQGRLRWCPRLYARAHNLPLFKHVVIVLDVMPHGRMEHGLHAQLHAVEALKHVLLRVCQEARL